MERHVILLNTVGGECAQGCKVLRQPDDAHDTGERGSIGSAEQPVVDPYAWVGLQGAANGADLHWHFQFADQGAVGANEPAGEGLVATGAGRVGMGCRFDGAPVVARRDGNRIHPVHDALVMGRRPIRIDQGQIIREDNAIAYGFSAVALASEVLR